MSAQLPRRFGRGPQVRITAPIRTHPIRMPLALLALFGVWVGHRRATRITPLIMIGVYLATPLGAVWQPWWFLAVVGGCITLVVWVTARQAHDPATDDSLSEQVAEQWANRVAVLPIAATGWLLLAGAMHRHGVPLASWTVTAAYICGCTSLWLFLFSARHLGDRILTEQVSSAWRRKATGTALDGSRVLTRRGGGGGTEYELDITDTGKGPSKLATAAAREEIAVRHKVPVSRVILRPDTADASRVRVQITQHNPWSRPIPHPLAPAFTTMEPRSIRDPILLGADPLNTEADAGGISKSLYTDDGAQMLLVIATTGAGKTVLVNSVVEHVTGSADADLIMIDTTKGMAAAAWSWACVRVHVGPDAATAAVTELEQTVKFIDQRAAQRRTAAIKRDVHLPTTTDPARVVVIDEADRVLVDAPTTDLRVRAQRAVKHIMSKGRSEGVILILICQRGTLDFLGTSGAKANASTRILLAVAQSSEMAWALPGWEGRGIPDMSTYGEGAAGVFVLAEPRTHQVGRSYALYEPELIEAIAMERCRPEHEPALIRRMHELTIAGHGVAVLSSGRWHALLSTQGLPALPPPATSNAEEAGTARLAPGGADPTTHEPPGGYSVPWGSPGAAPDDPTDTEPGEATEMTEQTRRATERAIATTAHAARAAEVRGPVDMEALIGAGHERAARSEAMRHVLDRLHMAYPQGWSRLELEAVTGQSERWCQRVLSVWVEHGVIVRSGTSRAIRYHAP
jgi:hypothetical protein